MNHIGGRTFIWEGCGERLQLKGNMETVYFDCSMRKALETKEDLGLGTGCIGAILIEITQCYVSEVNECVCPPFYITSLYFFLQLCINNLYFLNGTQHYYPALYGPVLCPCFAVF